MEMRLEPEGENKSVIEIQKCMSRYVYVCLMVIWRSM
jgi:hypothetical protein